MDRLVMLHNPLWKEVFRDEASAIHSVLGGNIIDVHHIGSTSIPDILAKPIIDILVEVSSLNKVDLQSTQMKAFGYEVMGAYGIEGRRYFRKTDVRGIRTHHVHIFVAESNHVERHLAFRDFLIAHPKKAQAYSQLKASLTRGGKASWDGYVDGKDPFIKATEIEALIWFRAKRLSSVSG
ncbi:MAG: hypothetical protein COA69_10595 [Robiginitomaculum sp.]|nr:MAG: hypothetical protein COA69_10595 [Robiginitomaculum sp.]